MTHAPVNPNSLARLLNYCERKRYPAKSVILKPGTPATMLYYLVEGTASVSVENAEGREIVLAHLSAGDFLGESGLFLDQKIRGAWVRARYSCELAEISYQRLRHLALTELAVEYADILFMLSSQMALRLRSAGRKVSDLAFLDVGGRVLNALQDISKTSGAIIRDNGRQVSITHQELGCIAGCSREMVGRVLKDLQRQNLIQVKGKAIVVVDGSSGNYAEPSAGLIFNLV
ncbi:MAG: cyclic nucleotide-binding domain-containing protein [Gammaproteobacteria bacterium]